MDHRNRWFTFKKMIFHGYVKWPDGIFKILNYCPHKETDSPSVSVQRVVCTYQWGAGVACDATNPTAKHSANLVNICEYIYNYQQLMAPDSRNMQKPIYQISDSLGCKPNENSGSTVWTDLTMAINRSSWWLWFNVQHCQTTTNWLFMTISALNN